MSTKKIHTPHKKGDRFTTNTGVDLKIMAIADNYVMLRYIGLTPFCMHLVKFQFFLKKMGAKKIFKR